MSRPRIPWCIGCLLPLDHDRFAGHVPTVFHIFTDGSAERNAAGWGSVLVAELGSGNQSPSN